MRPILRTMTLAGILALGGILGLETSSANAQGYGYGGHHGGHGSHVGGNYGGGVGIPSFSYYGNGGHDLAPHWHTRQTPFGASAYYGLGRHDFRPHGHVQTPYGITGYSNGLFNSTQSYSPPAPPVFRPW